MTNLLVVVDYVANVIATSIMRLAHRHRVMCEVDIAIIAEELWHIGSWQKKAGWTLSSELLMGGLSSADALRLMNMKHVVESNVVERRVSS